MNYYNKTHRHKIPFIFVLVLIGVVSCHFNKNIRETPTETLITPDSTTYDSGLSLPLSALDSIRIIYTSDETLEKNLPKEYWDELNTLLQSARYDTEWNDSGIMIAMIAQDYALILSYKDQPQEENEWLLIWRTNERIKYRNKWYFVDTKIKDSLCERLESWK